MRFYIFTVTYIALVLYGNVSAMPTYCVEETTEPLSKRDITNARVSHNAVIDHNGDLNGAVSAHMSADGDGQIHTDDNHHHGETYHFKEQGMKSEFHSDTETGAETRNVCTSHSEGTISPDD